MRRALTTASAVGAMLLVFCGISSGATFDLVRDNPATPLSGTTGGVVTTTPWVVGLIADGMTKSPTFATIVAQLLASNVLATVEPELRIKTGLSGYMVFITRTVNRRYLRIYVDPRMRRCQQISVLGHELRHALEVAEHPEVVDQETLRDLYVSIGRGDGDRWDSETAIEAGRSILGELTATPAATTAAAVASDVRP